MNDKKEKQLPQGVALSWGLVKSSKRGPKRELSLKQIVDVAINIADKEGLSKVSMSKVAASLGFTAMSLYRYIPSKEDLLLLMQDGVCDVNLTPKYKGENWRDAMREYVHKCIQIFTEHPWFTDIPLSGIPMTPHNLRMVDWVLQGLRDLPLNDNEKMSFFLLLNSYARANGLIKRDLDQAMRTSKEEEVSGRAYNEVLKKLVTPDRFPYLHPVVASDVYTGENTEEEGDDLDFGLERILDSIQHYVDMKNARRCSKNG